MIAPARSVSFDHLPSGTNPLDAAVRAWMVAHQTQAGLEVAAFVSRIGSVGPMRWVGMLAGVFFFAIGRGRATVGVAAAPWLAWAGYAGIRSVLPRERPPGIAGFHESASSFPSAHATTSAAVCCTIAYVLWREHLVPPPLALAIAIVPPLCIGLSRLYIDVHWSTDVVGGWCVGIIVATISSAIYRLWPSSGGR